MNKLVTTAVALVSATAGMVAFASTETQGLWKAVPGLWGEQKVHAYEKVKAKEEGVKSIMIESEMYQGKPTRFFAFYGLPKGASAEHKVPAMVLVHGGAGSAYSYWVKNWMDRGYAAISMDNCGGLPPRKKPRTTHEYSGPDGWGRFECVNEQLTEQWPYHAVAAVIRSHSFLRSLPEVDADKIGVTGISWGGYLTSCVSGIDDRFAFAAPVYGCAYLYDHSTWSGSMRSLGEKGVRWDALWDAKNFLGNMKKPVLWCTGSNDHFFPLDSLQRGYDLLGNAPQLSIKVKMQHSQQAGDPKEIAAFADHLLKGKPALPEIASAKMQAGKLSVKWNAHGRTIKDVQLIYTTSNDSNWEKREYLTLSGAFANNSTEIAVPENAVLWWVNLVTDDGYITSTRNFTDK